MERLFDEELKNLKEKLLRMAGLVEESVELAIEVIGHRRNSHGPFHLTEKWPWWTGPGEFTRGGDSWLEG